MALPPLYKYLDVQGAKLALGNRTFQHAKPSDFNDIEDLTIQSIFPEGVEAALTKLAIRGQGRRVASAAVGKNRIRIEGACRSQCGSS